jgi:protein required for attachment to host cells
MDDAQCHIAVCDERAATILRATLAPLDRVHLEEAASFRNRWVGFHDHGRPSLLGQGPSANAAQHFADEHREPLEMRRRFAREVASWLRTAAAAAPAAHLPVFVAPRFLGALRAELVDDIDGIEFFRAELQGLRAHEIAANPTVHALLRSTLLPHPSLPNATAAWARPHRGR